MQDVKMWEVCPMSGNWEPGDDGGGVEWELLRLTTNVWPRGEIRTRHDQAWWWRCVGVALPYVPAARQYKTQENCRLNLWSSLTNWLVCGQACKAIFWSTPDFEKRISCGKGCGSVWMHTDPLCALCSGRADRGHHPALVQAVPQHQGQEYLPGADEEVCGVARERRGRWVVHGQELVFCSAPTPCVCEFHAQQGASA